MAETLALVVRAHLTEAHLLHLHHDEPVVVDQARVHRQLLRVALHEGVVHLANR